MNVYQALGIHEVAERLLLVDGHSALFRSFYAIPDLATSKGEPTGALYGFVRTLLMALRQYPSRYVAVAFDAEGKTVRHEAYADYKATRKPMPEALARQLPRVRELLDVFGIPYLECPGYEADDVMATLSWAAEREGIAVLHLTGDKDMAQLVSDRVALLRPGRKPSDHLVLLDRRGVEERFGVPPERIVDLLALEGDAVDNVPGVKGVGEKTAVELLREHGSLEAVLAAADRVRNRRIAHALTEHREEALLSRELVRLKEVPLGLSVADCQPRPIVPEHLAEVLEGLEFRSILAELKLQAGPAPRYEVVLSEDAFAALLDRLAGAEELSLDLETTSTDPLAAEIVGIAVAVEPYEAYYIPVGHRYPGAPPQLPLPKVLAGLRPLLEGEKPRIIGQNLKYDLQVLAGYGIEARGVAFDAMIAHWLLRPDAPAHGLDVVVRDELGEKVQTYRELLAEGGEKEIHEVPVERAARYSGEDAEVVCRLRPRLTQRLREAELFPLFAEVEVPLIDVLRWMERRGVLLDVDVLREQGKELEVLLDQLRGELYALAGCTFNPNSTPQVREVLYGRLKLPVLERTKTGPSTDALVLRELALYHEFPGKLVAYRELEKLRNTYVEKLPAYVHPKTGRIHTSFNQTGTATGRLSSSDPNLQSIPSRHEVGVDIRRAFVAPPGRVLLGADYSQIELRILAHLCGDEGLIEAFRRGEDLHRRTASALFGVPPGQVDGRMRTVAKRVNFGIIYGISPYGLARDLGISQSDAKFFIDRFFAAYPTVATFVEALVEEARRTGYARTLLGRRRPLPRLAAADRRGAGADRRNAINTPIQGSAADLMKLAMLRLHEAWRERDLAAEMILQIHDELVFEVDEAEAAGAAERVKRLMEGVWELKAPLKVDVKSGKSWGEL
ncbi:MAG: DNA polymerase I [Candidatus Acetothermia bacterium]|jgi:DNA polymerase-1|nr:DNA polymerase I [Candidatus Acetothermia bacterium]